MNKDFNAGLFGGITGVIISHPIDTIRIRIQNNQSNQFRGLYKGITPPLIGVGMEKFLVFGNYEKFKNYNTIKNRDLNIIVSGMASGLICTSIVTPLERFKINFQSVNSSKQSRLALIKKTTNISTLYRGLSSTLIREVPGYGIYFGVYEACKRNTNNYQWYYSLLYGGLSGSSAWAVIYPSDVIKTRMQTDGNQYRNMRHCIKEIYREGGYPIFYRGFMAAMARAFILHAGVFSGYELYMKYG
jgi:solute carrier family 25 carnitine/acylcarnitine transporter 20/29